MNNLPPQFQDWLELHDYVITQIDPHIQSGQSVDIPVTTPGSAVRRTLRYSWDEIKSNAFDVLNASRLSRTEYEEFEISITSGAQLTMSQPIQSVARSLDRISKVIKK